MALKAKVLARSAFDLGGIRPSRDDPRGFEYWRREADAYASGLLAGLDEDGLVAPRCYGIDEEVDSCALWLEDLPDAGPATWPLEQFGIAARHLGRFGGRHLGDAEAAALPWLSRGRICEWLALGAPAIATMPATRREGLLATWLNDESVARIGHLWDRRERLIGAFEALPLTVCHHDAHRRNLATGHGALADRTIAYDWQMLGTGRLGEEVAPLVTVPLQFLDVPVSQARELETIVLEGFVLGLRDVGWSGDAESVRLGFLIATSLGMGLGGTGMWFQSMQEPESQQRTAGAIGRPLTEIGAQWSILQPYLLDLADEALSLVT